MGKKDEKSEGSDSSLSIKSVLLPECEIEEAKELSEAEQERRLKKEQLEVYEMEPGLPKPIIGQFGLIFCILILIGITVFFVTFFVLMWARNNSNGCGIDVYQWCQVFLAIASLSSLLLCPILCCMRSQHPLTTICATLTILLIITLALAGWVIYGYIIYFSDDNDCQKQYDTSVALVFMCIFLVLGLCCILTGAILLVAVPYVYFASILPMQQEKNNKPGPAYRQFQRVTRMGIAYMNVPQHKMALLQEPCIICCEGFDGEEEDSRAVLLHCGHIFHSGCIVAWVERGNEKCPICKKKIRPRKGRNGKNHLEGGAEDSDEAQNFID